MAHSFGCYEDRMECWLISVNAIGGVKIGRMDAPYAYGIAEVVESQFSWLQTTITIERSTKQVPWVEEPVNQTLPLCKDAENKIRKYTIENSPGWNRAFGKPHEADPWAFGWTQLLTLAWLCHHRREFQSFERVMHFAAVKKCLSNFHDHREIGYLAMIRHRAPNILVANSNSPAGNAKRFALTRNKEDQPNAWILQQVLESIDAAVSAPVQNCKGHIVKTPHESRAIPLGRQINHARRIG
jgi:hypothetical protein